MRRGAVAEDGGVLLGPEQAMKRIKKLEAEMYKHARNLEFEEAARIRDQIEKLRHQVFGVPGSLAG
jgi:excinuclease ABC subunit B